MDWFLHDNGLRHERVKEQQKYILILELLLFEFSDGLFFKFCVACQWMFLMWDICFVI